MATEVLDTNQRTTTNVVDAITQMRLLTLEGKMTWHTISPDAEIRNWAMLNSQILVDLKSLKAYQTNYKNFNYVLATLNSVVIQTLLVRTDPSVLNATLLIRAGNSTVFQTNNVSLLKDLVSIVSNAAGGVDAAFRSLFED